MTGRPLCLLDVDGVIAVLGEGPGEPMYDFFAEEIPLRIARGTPGRLSRLAEVFRLVWASSWAGRDCNELLCPALGLPELPFIPWSRDAPQGTFWKLPDVHAWAGDRPLVWIDDDLDSTARAWAEHRRAPTLLLQPDPRVGLTDPSLSTSGETLTIEESMTLRARTENAGDVGVEHEWSWSSG